MNHTEPLFPDSPTTALDAHARSGLEHTLDRLREGAPIEEDALVGLAWRYFVAGFAARHGDPQEPPAPARPEPTETDILAEHVAALTPRRLEVLRLVARGLTNREIGQVLGISAYTVKSHLTALFESLDVTNRTEAAFALQRYEALYPDASH